MIARSRMNWDRGLGSYVWWQPLVDEVLRGAQNLGIPRVRPPHRFDGSPERKELVWE